MNLLKLFDAAIAEEEGIPCGYCVAGRIFNSYLSNSEWEKHLAAMSQEHKHQFGKGSGGELESKGDRPPKMASFASSSRMVYNLSKNLPNFVFEKRLTTTVGGIANLDGYIKYADRDIYIEAKCREPYSHAVEQIVKQNYRGIYEYLCERMSDNFACTMKDIPDEGKSPRREMRVQFFCKGKPVNYFDMKQMICHLLAVATERLNHPCNRAAQFLYLLYDPSGLSMEGGVKEEVLRIYADTCWTAENCDFHRMFSYIVDYLAAHKKFAASPEEILFIQDSFTFTLCSQVNYAHLVD